MLVWWPQRRGDLVEYVSATSVIRSNSIPDKARYYGRNIQAVFPSGEVGMILRVQRHVRSRSRTTGQYDSRECYLATTRTADGKCR